MSSFELRANESLSEGARRVIGKRIDHALKMLAQPSRKEAVHEARTDLKKIRATLRLVRDDIGNEVFRRENRAFRDAGRPLSNLRDAEVLFEALESLAKNPDESLPIEALAHMRKALETRQARVPEPAYPEIEEQIRKARKRLRGAQLDARGWSAVRPNLERVYESGRDAMREARSTFSDAALHEWRKRAKDLRYELQLLIPFRPATLEPLVEEFHRLTDLLGEDHDLGMLRQIAEAEGVPDLTPVIDHRRGALQLQAAIVGERLYRSSPKKFGRRIKSYC
jgi:CHAD domain-containing protein